MKQCDFSSSEAIFTHIYQAGAWKKDPTGTGTSGQGSTLLEGFPFILLLNQFLATHSIQSIVDVGCGDWVLAQHINWESRNYLGVDIVKSLIEKNRIHHSSPTIRFAQLDITQERLPPADLLICKDVLIHLPLKEVFSCLSKAQKFKHAIFVHDIDRNHPLQNKEINMGEFRPLDLTQPPFNLHPHYQTSYISGCTVKHVLFFDHNL